MGLVHCSTQPAIGPNAPAYQRRRPAQSALFQLVRDHLETFLEDGRRRSAYGLGYPRYVEQTFRRFLICGQCSVGFARFACRACGHERLVAYSCKGRGLCPSCISKRSALTAAHLTDHVLPECDYRQWTLSVPYVLRYRLMRDGRLSARVLTVFVRTVFAWQKRRAKAAGLTQGHCGSVSLVQRYGSLVQVHPHTHTWIPDGVFVEGEGGALQFAPLPPPTDRDVAWLCTRICQRVMRRCDRQDEAVDDDDDGAMAHAQADALTSPLARPLWPDETAQPVRQSKPLTALHGGFSLHAGLSVEAKERRMLERLLRYGSRPPLAQRRLSWLPSGKIRLTLRKPTYRGQTVVDFDPPALLRRLLAILPPPRWHATRYHGIFSSHHKLRGKLTALVPRAEAVPRQRPAADPSPVEPEPVPENRRPTYAQLLSRVFPQDLGVCSRCGGKLRLIACIDDPKVVTKILAHLGLATQPPCPAPARSPPQLDIWDLGCVDDVDDADPPHTTYPS